MKTKERVMKNSYNWRYKNPERYLLNYIKQICTKNSLDFDISVEDIKIPEYCPVLGLKLSIAQRGTGRQDNSIAIDRIDYNKGFIKNNIIVVSHRAKNIRKMNVTVKEAYKIRDFYQNLL